MNNYIMLNGEKIELTDFQSNMIQMMVDDKKLGSRDIFDRVNKNEKYYLIAENGEVEEDEDIPIVFIPEEETGIGEYVDQFGKSGNNT